MTEPFSVTVAAAERLDVALGQDPRVGSRAAAQKLIEAGAVTVRGEQRQKRYVVKPGDTIDVTPPEPPTPDTSGGEDVTFDVAYEDDDLIVVDKPAGLVVHPSAGHSEATLVQGLAGRAAGGDDPWRPGVVHRLDKDTSGLMLVARNDQAHKALSAAVKRREVIREYTALIEGRLSSRTGTIDAPLGRHRRQRTKQAVKGAGSRDARTHFEVVEALPADTLVHARLETGRTHQIRVHFAAIDHAVVGDPEYGTAGRYGLQRQFLHASRLEFAHPRTGERLTFTSELPEDLLQALERARKAG